MEIYFYIYPVLSFKVNQTLCPVHCVRLDPKSASPHHITPVQNICVMGGILFVCFLFCLLDYISVAEISKCDD